MNHESVGRQESFTSAPKMALRFASCHARDLASLALPAGYLNKEMVAGFGGELSRLPLPSIVGTGKHGGGNCTPPPNGEPKP
jgi:hypothetical protein